VTSVSCMSELHCRNAGLKAKKKCDNAIPYITSHVDAPASRASGFPTIYTVITARHGPRMFTTAD